MSTVTNNISIRPANMSDAGILLHFINELASHVNAEQQVLATIASIETNIFSDNSHVHALICEVGRQSAARFTASIIQHGCPSRACIWKTSMCRQIIAALAQVKSYCNIWRI